MKFKKVLMAMSISLVALINYNLPVDAESINGILEEDKLYAPISEIVIKMGGAVRRNEEAKSYVFDINDSNIKITDGCFFAEIDGEIVPFETDKYEDTIIPVYKPAVYKEGQVYIPVDYIKEEVGLDIKVEGEKVTFKSKKLEEVIPEEKKDESKEEGEDSSEQEVETITTPNNSNDTPKIEHTKPETKPNKDENKNNTQTPPNNQTSTKPKPDPEADKPSDNNIDENEDAKQDPDSSIESDSDSNAKETNGED